MLCRGAQSPQSWMPLFSLFLFLFWLSLAPPPSAARNVDMKREACPTISVRNNETFRNSVLIGIKKNISLELCMLDCCAMDGCHTISFYGFVTGKFSIECHLFSCPSSCPPGPSPSLPHSELLSIQLRPFPNTVNELESEMEGVVEGRGKEVQTLPPSNRELPQTPPSPLTHTSSDETNYSTTVGTVVAGNSGTSCIPTSVIGVLGILLAVSILVSTGLAMYAVSKRREEKKKKQKMEDRMAPYSAHLQAYDNIEISRPNANGHNTITDGYM